MFPIATMSGTRNKQVVRLGNAMAYQQAQLITMHSQQFLDKRRVIKGLNVNFLVYHIPLQADDALDSLYHLKFEGESHPYEVR